jgi:glycosyltransferase involved in cell wall biosynthesis
LPEKRPRLGVTALVKTDREHYNDELFFCCREHRCSIRRVSAVYRDIAMENHSLVICPVYNERDTVETFYRKLRAYYQGDALFLDDGSTDGSMNFLSRLPHERVRVVRHAKRVGYGATLMSGFSFALKRGYGKILTIDVDLQHDPAHIPTFLERLEKSHVILGSRYLLPGARSNAPPERFLINRYIGKLIKTLFSVEITDPFCGLRGYRDSFLRKAQLKEKSYGLSLEILLEMVRTDAEHEEVSIEAIYFGRPRRFLDGLDEPRVRLLYYLNIIARKYREIRDERGIPV